MINAERGYKFCAGKEKSPKTKVLPEDFRSGRKRKTFTTVAKLTLCVALLNTKDEKSRIFNSP